jgi:hypothetical protein
VRCRVNHVYPRLRRHTVSTQIVKTSRSVHTCTPVSRRYAAVTRQHSGALTTFVFGSNAERSRQHDARAHGRQPRRALVFEATSSLSVIVVASPTPEPETLATSRNVATSFDPPRPKREQRFGTEIEEPRKGACDAHDNVRRLDAISVERPAHRRINCSVARPATRGSSRRNRLVAEIQRRLFAQIQPATSRRPRCQHRVARINSRGPC